MANQDWSSPNVENEAYLPKIISYLHPGLILSNPLEVLGKPSEGEAQIIAHENYWKNIQDLFELWQDTDLEGPLAWIKKQPNVDKPGLTKCNPAHGYQLWWMKGHWEAQLLAKIAELKLTNHGTSLTPKHSWKRF